MLRVIGLNYQNAPVDVRATVIVAKHDLPDVLRRIGTAVVLSTCNRTEIYVPEFDEGAAERATGFFITHLGPFAADRDVLYDWRGATALRHLCAVAAGLDSMVIGESQILGQVKEALLAAVAAGTAEPRLTRAFRAALRVGRRARHETFIGHHPLSVSRAAVELARANVGELVGKRVLVVGAGEMGELTAQALVDNGVGVYAVLNRTIERARDLANRYGGIAAPLATAEELLREADIVIASTDSPEPVIAARVVRAAMAARPDQPLFIIDIAVPRDVEPTVRSIDGVYLCDLDDLKARCEHNRHRRHDEIARVDTIVEQELDRLASWWESQSTLPTVVELRSRAEQARRAELDEALTRLQHLSREDQAVVDDLSRAIVNKLLHEPTVGIKRAGERGRPELVDLARELFGLEND
jgi:glutamyl-tRNA reductase